LEKLREEERKEDTVYKVARAIEDLAVKYRTRVAIGDVYKDKIFYKIFDNKIRHRIAQ